MSPRVDYVTKLGPFNKTKYTLWAYKIKMYPITKGLWAAENGGLSV